MEAMLHAFALTTSMPKHVTSTYVSRRAKARPRCQYLPFNLQSSLTQVQPLFRRPFPPPRCANNRDVVGPKTSERLIMDVEIELRVRDYELDKFGVVSDTTYSSYIQHGQHVLMEALGMDANAVAQKGLKLAVKDLSLKYISPLRSGNKFIVHVKIVHVSAARMLFEDSINKLPNLEPIVKGKSTVVWLDGNYRPVRVPSELVDKLIPLGLYA